MNQLNSSLRFIIVGMGVMGQKHYKVLKTIENIEIVGLVEPLGFKECSCPVYDNIQNLLKEIEFDCAIIATPTSTHIDVAVPLIKANKHILIEKPLAKNMKSVDYLKRLSLKSKSKIAIGYIERFNPAVTELKSMLRSGKLGEPLLLEFHRENRWPIHIKDIHTYTVQYPPLRRVAKHDTPAEQDSMCVVPSREAHVVHVRNPFAGSA